MNLGLFEKLKKSAKNWKDKSSCTPARYFEEASGIPIPIGHLRSAQNL